MKRYDIILLDADMTLLDFERSEEAALKRTLTKWGLPCDEDAVRTYSRINAALWDAFARGELDQDFITVERFSAFMRIYGETGPARELNRDYQAFLGEEAFPLPGALDFCRTLREQGFTPAIATNGLPVAQRGRWERTRLNKIIPDIFISMELGIAKPRKEYFDLVLERLGVTDRSRVVMIGDSLKTDIQGANNAGLDSIWYNPRALPLTGPAVPTYTAANYDEILSLLREED